MFAQGHGFIYDYGVALVSRIDKIIGLFCKRALQKRQYSAKETYNFIDPTHRSHPIVIRISTDTSIYQKRPIHIKRDQFTSKETNSHQKTYSHQKGPTYIKRDTNASKETYKHQMRPTKMADYAH